MHTAPSDLAESALLAALRYGWGIDGLTIQYRPVGFGSHHWEVEDAGGVRWFVTVDDLRVRRLEVGEPLTAAYDRLGAALATAQALRAAGRDFVVAPVGSLNGEPLQRLGESFAVAVYPFIVAASFTWDDFSPEHRLAIVDLLGAVHSAPAEVCARAVVDDYALQCRDVLAAALDGESVDESMGPYAGLAAELVARRADMVRRALAQYDALVRAARIQPPALVLTHGEPHPGNTMRANGTWLLIDWDTTLVAPRERDLWDLDEGDGSVWSSYAEATGTVLRDDLVELYRLRWHLTDLGLAVARFRAPHGGTADDDETWAILQESLTALER